MRLSKHKIQAISLLAAVILLWIPFGLSRVIASVIIGINIVMEYMG